MAQRQQKQRLTAQDWADAALTAMGEGGLAAVAVEPLAARLGTTKGSFYWHFANRAALIDAALARWEETGTEAVIDRIEAEPDPERRLRTLFAVAKAEAAEDPLELSLLATADHPQVAAVLRRVTERRVAYVAGLFEQLGFPPEEARHRGFLAYTSYLGHIQLARAVPEAIPSGAAEGPHLDAVLDTVLGRGDGFSSRGPGGAPAARSDRRSRRG
ncbi:TetR/AcrR family transcriptional regulator [Streptomyces sp. A7024]|uniref:TetR/AcrR family transcriptional regulator n=1 Tax=Streptomyces coryli TaxID=1128680 RepID=A0A6G4TRR8_9ACTN|nr:TetR/AcrR family transcriptional regulator [Streptomyces coryli]NGN62685.1 TetR/AcrR family transcriptional regulator [Streptomyces coryli]